MKSVKLLTMLVVCLVLVGFSGKALALPGWAFSDGFEGVTAATLPSAADLDPDKTIWNWTDAQETEAGSETAFQVGNGPFAAAEGDNFLRVANAASTPSYAFFERSWGNSNPAPQNAIANLTDDFVWEFSLRVEDTATNSRVFLGKRTSSTNPLGVQQALGVAIEGGRLKHYYHDVGQDIQAVSLNAWHDIKVVGDWSTQTFALSLNGSEIGNNYAFNYDYSSDIINSVHMISWYGDSYLDNVTLVPEPATMCLLLVGLPLLRKRK
jgi:hypothetical protein